MAVDLLLDPAADLIDGLGAELDGNFRSSGTTADAWTGRLHDLTRGNENARDATLSIKGRSEALTSPLETVGDDRISYQDIVENIGGQLLEQAPCGGVRAVVTDGKLAQRVV